jgi:hypothetical protein
LCEIAYRIADDGEVASKLPNASICVRIAGERRVSAFAPGIVSICFLFFFLFGFDNRLRVDGAKSEAAFLARMSWDGGLFQAHHGFPITKGLVGKRSSLWRIVALYCKKESARRSWESRSVDMCPGCVRLSADKSDESGWIRMLLIVFGLGIVVFGFWKRRERSRQWRRSMAKFKENSSVRSCVCFRYVSA